MRGREREWAFAERPPINMCVSTSTASDRLSLQRCACMNVYFMCSSESWIDSVDESSRSNLAIIIIIINRSNGVYIFVEEISCHQSHFDLFQTTRKIYGGQKCSHLNSFLALIFHVAIAFIHFWHAHFLKEHLNSDNRHETSLYTRYMCVCVCQFTREIAYLFCAHIKNIETTSFMRKRARGYSCIKYTLGNHHQHHLAPNKHWCDYSAINLCIKQKNTYTHMCNTYSKNKERGGVGEGETGRNQGCTEKVSSEQQNTTTNNNKKTPKRQ